MQMVCACCKIIWVDALADASPKLIKTVGLHLIVWYGTTRSLKNGQKPFEADFVY